jgi:hypothetical protein
MFGFIDTALQKGPKFFFQRGGMANTGKYINIKIIAVGVLHDVVHGLCQGHPYLQSIIQFHGTKLRVIPFKLLKKV